VATTSDQLTPEGRAVADGDTEARRRLFGMLSKAPLDRDRASQYTDRA